MPASATAWQERSEEGWCPVCSAPTTFIETGPWLRDEYLCARCRSIPRHRAFMTVLRREVPDYRNGTTHESCPAGPCSDLLAREVPGLTFSAYMPWIAWGNVRGDGMRSETLEAPTFPDEAFDLFITQDVFEHVLRPLQAFAEIARVLRPSGVHVWTVPCWMNRETRVRAKMDENGKVVHLLPPEYHQDPNDPGGALVATEWGRDLPEVVERASGMRTAVHVLRNRWLGIDGEFLEVFVSRKPRDEGKR